MKYDFAVVGANGMQGQIVSRDLIESGHSALLCANDTFGLDNLLKHKKTDFAFINLKEMDKTREALKKSNAKVLVNCAIDDFNFVVTQASLDLGMHYIDLGAWESMINQQFPLHEDFKKKNLTAIIGTGSTPGVTNVMLRHVKPKFDTIHTVHLGFAWNSNMDCFVPPFSIDAIAYEFTTKATIFENGEYVQRMPQECPYQYTYKEIGKQTTWYTDHMEHFTFREYLKDMGIKNIAVCSSFPDYSREAIMNLIKLGFTKYNNPQKIEAIEVKGMRVEPLDFTEALLRKIPIPEGYKEKENLWLKVWGTKNGKEKYIEMDAIAGTLPGWEEHTCNIDTGMPASIMAQMMLKDEISERGVTSPEFAVPPVPFFKELARRNIPVYENGRKIKL
jgi:lysine 6-dehydrogenase